MFSTRGHSPTAATLWPAEVKLGNRLRKLALCLALSALCSCKQQLATRNTLSLSHLWLLLDPILGKPLAASQLLSKNPAHDEFNKQGFSSIFQVSQTRQHSRPETSLHVHGDIQRLPALPAKTRASVRKGVQVHLEIEGPELRVSQALCLSKAQTSCCPHNAQAQGLHTRLGAAGTKQ